MFVIRGIMVVIFFNSRDFILLMFLPLFPPLSFSPSFSPLFFLLSLSLLFLPLLSFSPFSPSSLFLSQIPGMVTNGRLDTVQAVYVTIVTTPTIMPHPLATKTVRLHVLSCMCIVLYFLKIQLKTPLIPLTLGSHCKCRSVTIIFRFKVCSKRRRNFVNSLTS